MVTDAFGNWIGELALQTGAIGWTIGMVVAKSFIDKLREVITKGMTQKARSGIWPSMAPIGFLNTSRGSIKTIEPDPATAPRVAALFARFA